jgi:alkanesulfonate monooxygenase SsuD/methylene tetrahydromethanopterin reductase-like flavin-dependent oxidoreductase (luciferase family)
MFKTIAEHADGWTLSSLYLPKPEDYKHEIEELQSHFEKSGRSIEALKKAQGIGCVVARNTQELSEKTKKFPPLKLSFENYVTTQPRLEGTPDQCVEKLREYVNVGVTHFILTFPDDITLEPIRLFGEHVIPAFK